MSDTAADNADPKALDLAALAHLAHLRIDDPAVAEPTGAQIDRLLGHLAILQDVDTGGIEPTAYPIAIPHRLAADEPPDPLPRDAVLANAPAERGGCFLGKHSVNPCPWSSASASATLSHG